MFNNENIYVKYSELSSDEKIIYYELVYLFVRRLSLEYPGFLQWYENLFINGRELRCDREIIVCEKDFSIAGLAILKSDDIEKKICTLRVAKEFQRQGIGKKLFEMSMEWLEDDHPVITMHKLKKYQFAPLLDFYGFKLEETKPHYYNFFSTEYVYNGVLPDEKMVFNKLVIADMRDICKQFIRRGGFENLVEEYLNVWHGCNIRKMI